MFRFSQPTERKITSARPRRARPSSFAIAIDDSKRLFLTALPLLLVVACSGSGAPAGGGGPTGSGAGAGGSSAGASGSPSDSGSAGGGLDGLDASSEDALGAFVGLWSWTSGTVQINCGGGTSTEMPAGNFAFEREPTRRSKGTDLTSRPVGSSSRSRAASRHRVPVKVAGTRMTPGPCSSMAIRFPYWAQTRQWRIFAR